MFLCEVLQLLAVDENIEPQKLQKVSYMFSLPERKNVPKERFDFISINCTGI
jgi:hypothetical protein